MAPNGEFDKMNESTAPIGVPARAAALKLLDAVIRRGLPLESALDRAVQGLDRGEDRALAHAIAGEVLRHLTDLDAMIDSATAKPLPHDAKARFVLRIALAQALRLNTPPHAAIATVLPLVEGGPKRLVHGVFGALMRQEATLPDPPSLPPELAARWAANWGEAMVEAAQRTSAAQPPLDLTLRDPATTAEWVERLGGSSLAPGHVRVAHGGRVTELAGFAEGHWWVQDISASLPARLLGAGVKKNVLDLCAAPGGKTMQLAATGWNVVAVDLSESRLKRVTENLKRTRLHAKKIVGDALTFTPTEPADAVLLDAPCSATGIFRRHPDVLQHVRPRAIQGLAERQQAMLARVANWVKPGGTLIYSVCSLEPEEGEHVAAAFLAGHSAFAADPIGQDELPEGFAPNEAGEVRVLPGAAVEADGFFVARFRRS
jgi:16S rRNA (cytosine967-C5)-methyltransferase